MKTILAFSFFLVHFTVLGQKNDWNPQVMPYDSTKNDVIYESKFECDTFKKNQIYSAAILSITKLFNSANDVVQLKDESSGKIIVKARFNVTYKGLGMVYPGGYVTYTTTISCKDSKCKIEISQITHHKEPGKDLHVDGGPIANWWSDTMRPWKFYSEQTHIYCINLLTELKSEINSNLNQLDDDW